MSVNRLRWRHLTLKTVYLDQKAHIIQGRNVCLDSSQPVGCSLHRAQNFAFFEFIAFKPAADTAGYFSSWYSVTYSAHYQAGGSGPLERRYEVLVSNAFLVAAQVVVFVYSASRHFGLYLLQIYPVKFTNTKGLEHSVVSIQPAEEKFRQ